LDRTEHGADQALADLESTIESAREDLVRASEADPELVGMGTTVTALLHTGTALVMAHLGDSRAYLLRDGVLSQVTVDHTFVQHLVDTGRISPDEAETHPQRNVVMRVLGDFDVDLTPDMSVREARAGDRWMLCSDGLSGFVGSDQITEVLDGTESPEEAADVLLTLAMTAGSTDNITVVVADVVDEGPEAAPATDDAQIVGAAATGELPEALRAGPSDEDAADEPGGDPDEEDPDDEEYDDEDDDDARPRRRGRPWITALVTLVVLGGIGYGLWWAYGWTQQQYYVGVADGEVAVYQGIPASAGPLTLSTPVELTGTSVDELPEFWADQLDGSIRASSQDEARARADRLIAEAQPEPTPTPSDTPSPDPSDAADADEEPDGGSGGGGNG
jgi:protein phosphatase